MWGALLFSTMGNRPSGSPETSFNLAENLKSDDYLDGLALGDEGNSKALLQAEKPENTHTGHWRGRRLKHGETPEGATRACAL